MSYVKIWLHCVWSSKNKIPFLTPERKYDIISHIRVNAGTKGIYIDSLNGCSEHLHSLLLLNCDYTLAFVMQMIRGESSYWINKKKLAPAKFEWADEYYGASVSESQILNVREYIKNQEEYHKLISWDEEYADLLRQGGFLVITDKYPDPRQPISCLP